MLSIMNLSSVSPEIAPLVFTLTIKSLDLADFNATYQSLYIQAIKGIAPILIKEVLAALKCILCFEHQSVNDLRNVSEPRAAEDCHQSTEFQTDPRVKLSS